MNLINPWGFLCIKISNINSTSISEISGKWKWLTSVEVREKVAFLSELGIVMPKWKELITEVIIKAIRNRSRLQNLAYYLSLLFQYTSWITFYLLILYGSNRISRRAISVISACHTYIRFTDCSFQAREIHTSGTIHFLYFAFIFKHF